MIMKPGGYHIMLISLHKPLKAGDLMDLSIQFESGKLIELSIPVVSIKKCIIDGRTRPLNTHPRYIFQNITRVIFAPSSHPFLAQSQARLRRQTASWCLLPRASKMHWMRLPHRLNKPSHTRLCLILPILTTGSSSHR